MKLINTVTIFCIVSLMYLTGNAQINALDFANFTKYHEANKTVTAPKAVLLGNSITEGWANEMPDFFTQNKYVGRGISGQTSSQLLLRFRQDVIDLKPAVVVINIGTNDIAENTGPYDEKFTLGNIESMLEIAKNNKIKVILASVIPADRFSWRPTVTDGATKIIALNEGIKKLCKKHKVTYLDYHSALANKKGGLDKEMAEDGVHPTIKCFGIMAKLLKAAIDKA